MTDRSKVLLRFAERVLDRQDEVLDLIQLENAFPALTQTWEYHHPKGMIGVISPWNYPLTLGISDALPALVAGNAVIAKPDGQTPYTALWAAELLEEAGLPPGVLQVVTGSGPELGEPLIEHCDFLMFTGSTRVGRIVAAQAATRLTNYSMELGGKNAILVLADADLARAVPGAVRAAFANTGQLCISMERMYIDAAVWDKFVPRFARATRSLRLGHSLAYTADIGSLISAKQLDTGSPDRQPAGGRIRQRQRGLRGHLGVRRRAHGRLEGLGRWQQARRAWNPQVHQCPDHLGSAADAHRAAGRDASWHVRQGHDSGDADLAAAARPQVAGSLAVQDSACSPGISSSASPRTGGRSYVYPAPARRPAGHLPGRAW